MIKKPNKRWVFGACGKQFSPRSKKKDNRVLCIRPEKENTHHSFRLGQVLFSGSLMHINKGANGPPTRKREPCAITGIDARPGNSTRRHRGQRASGHLYSQCQRQRRRTNKQSMICNPPRGSCPSHHPLTKISGALHTAPCGGAPHKES